MNILSLPIINIFAQSVIHLSQDFTGFSININGFYTFVLSFIGATFLFFLLYLIGFRLLSIFLKNIATKDYAVFFSLIIGYIFFGTGIALIGIFSFLTPFVIFLYLVVITVGVLFPQSLLLTALKELWHMLSSVIYNKRSLFDILLLFFILIAFLRLILPESSVDGVGYHLSYPKEYLAQHSLMIKSQGAFYFVAIPQLGEMLYIVAMAFGLDDATRIIHFYFYIAIVLVFMKLFKSKSDSGRFAALLFVTAPIVIKETSITYTDFQCLFCWVVAFWIVTNEKLTTYRILSASLAFGAALATKPQTAYFVIVFIIYIFLKSNGTNLKLRIRNVGVFLLGISAIVGLWYLRAYILTGNPLYPAFSQSFGGLTSVVPVGGTLSVALLDRLKSMSELSPVVIVGILILIPSVVYKVYNYLGKISLTIFWQAVRKWLKIPVDLGLLTLFILIEYIGLPRLFSESRYLLFGYLPILMVLTPRLTQIYKSSYVAKNIFVGIIIILIGYYFLQTALVLAYGFGWANQNHYLTRILSRDNSSYYDFNEIFSNKISSKDLVGIYGIDGLYYAHFHYQEISYILNGNNQSLHALKKAGITKLLLKNVTIQGFCLQEHLTDCANTHVLLVARYEPAYQYLYSLK